MMSAPKGQKMDKTLDGLMDLLEEDAKQMMDMAREISDLKHKVNQLQQKLTKQRRTNYE